MMGLRRALAIFLALFFIILFIPLLIIYRIDSTVANPKFYVDQLRKAEIYDFLYNDVLPAAFSEMNSGGGGNQAGNDFAWIAPYATDALKETLPPEWLQTQTERTVEAVVPYFTGSSDSFAVNIILKDRVEAGAGAIRKTLHKDDFTNRLYNQGIEIVVSAAASTTSQLPFPLDETEVQSLVQRLLPVDWIVTQLDTAINEVTLYFTKDKEHFTIRINIIERIDDVQDAVTDLVGRPEIYDYLVNELLIKMIAEDIPAAAQVIPGVTLSAEEILPAVKQVLSLDWYQAQVSSIATGFFDYLKGTQSGLNIAISIADRKPIIITSLSGLLDQKLEQYYNSLPLATPAQALAWMANPPADSLPVFRLPGVSYADLKELVNINLETMLAPVLSTAIPDQVAFTEADFASAGGESPLAKLRGWVQQGLTYTEQQLIASAGSQRVEDIRKAINSGVTFTHEDLRKAMSRDGNAGSQDLDKMRSAVGTARRALTLAWIVPLLMLGSIGLLGGRTWGSKLVWAGVVLGVAALIAVIAAGPVFSALAQPQIDRVLMQMPGDAGSLEALLASKGSTIVQNAVGSFIGGLRVQAIIFLLVSAGLIVAGSIWHKRTV